jgi:hypothetical protein
MLPQVMRSPRSTFVSRHISGYVASGTARYSGGFASSPGMEPTPPFRKLRGGTNSACSLEPEPTRRGRGRTQSLVLIVLVLRDFVLDLLEISSLENRGKHDIQVFQLP